MNSTGRLALWVAYTAILYVSFAHDGYGVLANPREGPIWSPDTHPRDGYIGYDSYLVLNRMRLAQDGIVSPLGPLGEYRSQFGLQGVGLTALQHSLRLDPVAFGYIAARGFALITAGVLAAFFVSVTRTLGPTAGGLGAILTACSPILLKLTPSIYWTSYTLFAPFVAAWCWWPALARWRWGGLALCAIIAGLVAIKSLCGYEFLTCVVLSPIVAVAFHRMRDGTMSWRFLGQAAALWASGVIGFALALALHVAQLNRLPDVQGNGLEVVLNRARLNSLTQPPYPVIHGFIDEQPLLGLNPEASKKLNSFLHYFRLPAFVTTRAVPALRRDVSVGWVTAFAGLFIFAAVVSRRSPDFRALAVALAFGLIASLSWQVAMINHMCIHFHLNPIVFHLPFLPLAYVAAGYVVQRALVRAGVETTGAVLVPAAAAVLLVALVADRDTPAVRAATEKAAWSAVRPYLDGGQPPASPNLRGNVGDYVLAVNCPGDEMTRSLLMRENTPAGDWIIISGWGVNGALPPAGKLWLSVPRAGVSVVVTQGGHVVPCRAKRYDIRHLRDALRLDGTDAGFELIIPAPLVDPDTPLRVFLVSEPDRMQVTELPLPPRRTVH